MSCPFFLLLVCDELEKKTKSRFRLYIYNGLDGQHAVAKPWPDSELPTPRIWGL